MFLKAFFSTTIKIPFFREATGTVADEIVQNEETNAKSEKIDPPEAVNKIVAMCMYYSLVIVIHDQINKKRKIALEYYALKY